LTDMQVQRVFYARFQILWRIRCFSISKHRKVTKAQSNAAQFHGW